MYYGYLKECTSIGDLKIKIAIIQENSVMCRKIWEYLRLFDALTLVGVARDGVSGLNLLLENEVDVFLLDIALPIRDGYYVLEKLAAAKQKNKPSCIILPNVNSRYIKSKAKAYGLLRYAQMPLDSEWLVQQIIDAYNEKNRHAEPFEVAKRVGECEEYVLDILHHMNIKNNLNGYDYLKTAIILAIKDASMMDSFTKVLYPAIAKAHDTTAANVEKSIRHAIEAFRMGCTDHQSLERSGLDATQVKSMTNSRFIKHIVERYHAGVLE